MRRGEVWWADLPEPRGHRPVLILTRDRAIPVRNAVTMAEITRTLRDIPVEVRLDEGDGMPTACVVNLDVINTVPKLLLTERITALSEKKMAQVEAAIRYALGMRDK
ncbi:MAG: type II toxin-antitoxin system PemK/MazF family toxin [Anaerolineales bacterium]|nr:type II toxin-antitoxin system PemK/MazF family toxin [Anaerolineales bacterium]